MEKQKIPRSRLWCGSLRAATTTAVNSKVLTGVSRQTFCWWSAAGTFPLEGWTNETKWGGGWRWNASCFRQMHFFKDLSWFPRPAAGFRDSVRLRLSQLWRVKLLQCVCAALLRKACLIHRNAESITFTVLKYNTCTWAERNIPCCISISW